MDLLFLGTGTSHGVPMIGCDCAVCASGDPKNRRTRTSGLFSWDGRNILVDTSVDFREQMLRHRVKRLDGVLLTHGHADHLFGLDDIRRFNYLQKEDIGLWGNAETLGRVRSCFDYAFAPDRDTIPGGGIPRVNLHEAAGPVSLFGETILPVPVRHGPWGILGWRIRNTAWVTDCNGIPEASRVLLRGLDLLVLGALRHRPHPTHFTLAESVQIARSLEARRTLFVHMAHDLDHDATNATLPPGMALAYDGQVVEGL